MKRTYHLLLAVLTVGLLAGCGPKEQTLSGTERDAVLAFSESKTDNLMDGMNTNDYRAFSKDFDQEMLDAMTPEQFGSMKMDRDEKLGLYVSRQVDRVVQIGDFYAVIYDAVFEKEDSVSLRVVFRTVEPHAVSGLWFSK